MNQMRAAIMRGFLAGSALSATGAAERVLLLPPRVELRLSQIAAYGNEHRLTTQGVPFVHASDPRLLELAPAVAGEWFIYRMKSPHRTVEDINAGWAQLAARRNEIRGPLGTMTALDSLAMGISAPFSGEENPHYFDDMALARAAALAALGSDDDLVRGDAENTHALDGVWCALATARFLRRLIAGDGMQLAIDAARSALPPESWSERQVSRAMEAVQVAPSSIDAVIAADSVVDHIYSFAAQAPDTLALLLAHASQASDAPDLLLRAAGHARNSGVLLPLAAATAAVAFGDSWVPEASPALRGICFPEFDGLTFDAVTAELEGMGR